MAFALLAALGVFGCRGKGLDSPYGSGGGREPPGDLCISEIMYHPVLKDSLDEKHEFIEVFNRGDSSHNLKGISIKGVGFTFGDYELAEGDYVVVAKDRDALLSNPHYELDPARVLGNFDGALSNNGETVSLEVEDGTRVDSVSYSDAFPWPIAADALGAGESWLTSDNLPLELHRHGGRSLERVSCASVSSSPANWLPSPLDGATPGGPPDQESETLLPVVEALSVRTAAGSRAITEDDEVEIEVTFTSTKNLGGARIEYFIDDLSIDTEELRSMDLSPDTFSATLEAAPSNSIVRYRIMGDRGSGEEVISPRPTDPYEFHAYFVDPLVDGKTRPYHLFIAPENWSQLWDHVSGGRADGCDVNESWQSRVPAVFVHQGHVYNVQVRYQGSRWNRENGPNINFEGNGPARPNPTKGLSWRIGFPRYDRFEGRSVMILNKLTQGCPGYTAIAGFELFRDHDLPGTYADYRRLFVNGAYYRYMMELHRLDDDLMRLYHEETDGGEVGHLFKSSGLNGDEGPWGWGNGTLLEDSCGYSASERYEYTYKRKSHDWDTTPRVEALLRSLNAARDVEGEDNHESLRAHLSTHFDVDKMLTHLAIMATIGPWDDVWHNYGLYQRTDEKWILVPWDLDRTLGGNFDARGSLFAGEQGDPDNVLAWNVIKDSFFRAYREEFVDRVQTLGRTSLSADRISALIDQAAARAHIEEATEAPGGTDCDFENAAEEMKSFIEERAEFIQEYNLDN